MDLIESLPDKEQGHQSREDAHQVGYRLSVLYWTAGFSHWLSVNGGPFTSRSAAHLQVTKPSL